LGGPIEKSLIHYNANLFRHKSVFFSTSGKKSTAIVLKDTLLDTIFEVKLEYRGTNNLIFGIIPEMKTLTVPIKELPYPKFSIDHAYQKIKLQNSYYNSPERKCPTLDVECTHLNRNVLTILLNMLPGQNCMYFWINDVLSRHVLTNIPHRKKQLMFDSENGELITFLSIKYPPKSSIKLQLNNKFMCWDYNLLSKSNYHDNIISLENSNKFVQRYENIFGDGKY
jgi:hypothetical protein